VFLHPPTLSTELVAGNHSAMLMYDCSLKPHHPAVAIAHPNKMKSTITAETTVMSACPRVSLNLRGGDQGVSGSCMGVVVDLTQSSHVMQYAHADKKTKRLVTNRKAGSSRAQWFLVCLW